MESIENKFFQLLRLSIGSSSIVPRIQSAEWIEIYDMAARQSLLGVAFDGVEKIGETAGINSSLLLKWLGQCRMIEKRNHVLNDAVIHISAYVKKNGFESCILKGQGNALMYPHPLHRSPGDIDIWVSGSPAEVIRFVRTVEPEGKASYHHIDFPSYKGIPIEVHYRPCYVNNWVYNSRLQRYFRSKATSQFSNRVEAGQGGFSMPTLQFNIVYQLVHIYNHVLQEGIGLRQFVDYYFVLKSLNTDGTEGYRCHDGRGEKTHTDFTECTDWAALQRELKWLGLWKFAGAVMYVLHEVLGLPREWMIAPIDERRGKLLLDEIMRGGNFGQHAEKKHSGSMTWRHNVYRLQKDLKLMRYYPGECLAEPFYRMWHFVWRMKHR